jgi:hypothetical protein
VALASVVVPLARLETAFNVDQLPLAQELAADLGQPIPGHQVVVLGPLRRAVATKLVGGHHEVCQCRRLPEGRTAAAQDPFRIRLGLWSGS